MKEQRKFIVGEKEDSLRLDKFLSGRRLPLSRSRIQNLIREGEVSVNDSPSRCSYRVVAGDEVGIFIPDLKPEGVAPEDIPLDILYEDKDLLVVNKPAGMVVHPAAGHSSGTLVNALLFHFPRLSTVNGPLRPGIVHRLDKDTSGALVVAKTNEAHLYLAREISEHNITRKYLALVQGHMELEKGTVEIPLGRHIVERKKIAVRYQGGKPAITHYRVLERFSGVTLLEVTLATGRTHQIRVHFAHLGHPLVGDKTYGGRKELVTHSSSTVTGFGRQALHAYTLGFIHPSKMEYMEFMAPFPEDMEKLLKDLRE